MKNLDEVALPRIIPRTPDDREAAQAMMDLLEYMSPYSTLSQRVEDAIKDRLLGSYGVLVETWDDEKEVIPMQAIFATEDQVTQLAVSETPEGIAVAVGPERAVEVHCLNYVEARKLAQVIFSMLPPEPEDEE